MKPFNLEEAKAGHPVCTRDGRPVRILNWDTKRNEYPILAIIIDDLEVPLRYTNSGKVSFSPTKSGCDLMMASEKHEGWINLYRTMPEGYVYTDAENVYSSKEEAENVGSVYESHITTIHIEWEE